MNVNPYAPPADAGSGGLPPPAAGSPQDWQVGEVVSLAWEAFKRDWVVLVFAPFVAALISSIPNQLPTVALIARLVKPESTEYWVLYGIGLTLGIIVSTFFQVGQIRIFLAAARGQRPEFGTLFGGADRFLALLGTTLLAGVLIVGGYLLLIVPGVILALGLSLATFYTVDAELGPVEAMKASWEATRGYKGRIFLFGFAAIGIMLLGLLACCVGMYAATPIIWVALATIFVRLSGRGTAVSQNAPPQFPSY